jgi:NDMA-dependent alcohol dehydrogenase
VVARPSGTVTFLFTDIEGSTRRWEADPEAMRRALEAHDDVLRAVIGAHAGWMFKHTGDGVCAAFASADDAVAAAVDAQRRLELPVRMGLATGSVELRGDDYFGPALNRTARVMSAGHGGQILVAAGTAALAPAPELIDLGVYRLRDLSQAEHVFQVRADGLQSTFAPLRTVDAIPGNLPILSTSFVGRTSEVKEVVELVRAHRLVTLTGVGGVGKTRLALQVAAELTGEFPDGVWLVELAPVVDPGAVPDAVATALGVTTPVGHEGAGVVEEVGENVSWLKPGDHVVFGFIPSCGRCPSCSTGHQNLCDLGALLGEGRQITDGTARHHAQGQDLGLMCLLGTFAHHTVVNEASCIKIDEDVPLDRACLLGCGVVTGWGSAVYAADVQPGETVAVVGVGGIGANAIQGAKLAGAKQIVAIDPLENKRERAMEFGATHTAASLEEALPLITDITWGRMANKVIMTMGVGDGTLLASALANTAKRGRVVITNIHPALEMTVNVSLTDLTGMEKEVFGSLFGSGNPRYDIPKLLGLWREGQLDLDGLVTKTYTLDGVNEGYDDMRNGRNIRGVMVYS